MRVGKESNVVLLGGLEVTLRLADERDMGFCYELMSHNMKDLFDRNAQERWSRAKFKSGFKPNRITIIEHENMPVGFFDYELCGDNLYWHNVQLSEDYCQKGLGIQITRLVEQAARDCGISVIVGKVFSENLRIISWLQRCGYYTDKKIEQENSYWVRKNCRKRDEIS